MSSTGKPRHHDAVEFLGQGNGAASAPDAAFGGSECVPGPRGAWGPSARQPAPDLGTVTKLPAGLAAYAYLPGSAYSLVIEIVSEHSENGEYADKAVWYAPRGSPEYWIVDQTHDRLDDDAMVLIHRLTLSGGKPAYVRDRTLLLSDLETEYSQR